MKHVALQTHPPKWVELILTSGYALLIGGLCLQVGLHLNRWISCTLCLRAGGLLFVLMAAFFIMSMVVGKTYLVAGGRMRTYLCGVSTFLMIWLGTAFLLADLASLLLRWTGLLPDAAAWCRWSGTVCVLTVAVLTVAGLIQRTRIRVVHETFPLVEGTCRMVLLSDLHIGYYVGAKHIRKVVDAVNGLHPDVVVISGDIINAGNTNECPELEQVEALLASIEADVYAVVGNHDPDVQDAAFQVFLKASHIHLLEDAVYTTDKFHLVGRTTCTKPRKALREILPTPSLPEIVLDHDPQGIREAVPAKASCILCGHTHKGQVFPLNLFVRMAYSKEETWGCSKMQDTYTVVTAGAGYFSMPMRLGSSCEVVCLDIGRADPCPSDTDYSKDQ